MQWQQLYKSIENKEFSGVCLMHGAEEYLKDAAISKAIEVYVPTGLEDINITKITEDDADKILNAANMLPFMAEKRIVIIDGYKKLLANKNQYKTEDMLYAVETVKKLLEQDIKDCCVFFLVRGKVEATNPLYKVFKKHDAIASYDSVKDNDKVSILLGIAKQKGMDISSSVIGFLVKYTNGDLLTLENELNKLRAYKDGKIVAKDVEDICHASTDYNVFNMIKAIDNKREQDALKILKDMLRGGEYVGGIVSLIERQYRALAFIEDINREYRGRVDYNELEKRLGVKSFVIEKMYKKGLNMDRKKREKIISMCVDADYLSKSGKINDVAALENLVIKLMAV